MKFHAYCYDRTGGHLGRRMAGVPTLLLRTVGRRSGEPRTSPLVYAADGATYVVVASNNGSDRPPGWLFNLEASDDVGLQVGRRRCRATARVLSRGDADYDRCWQLVNSVNRGRYDRYQAKTTRPIPLVVLSPTEHDTGRS